MFSAKRIKFIFPSSSSLSAEKIASNDDLLTQILLRLPMKPLLKFKCVSKHWLSLISSRRFCRHLKLSDSPCAIFIEKLSRFNHLEFGFINLDSNNHIAAPFKTLTFANELSGIRIIQSCNGLLLCSSFIMHSAKSKYYIYNPTTKQYTILPPLSKVGKLYGVYLAFDPSKSHKYKVMFVRNCKPNYGAGESSSTDSQPEENQIEIYSSKTGLWRVSAVSFMLEFSFLQGGVFWKGAIHWYSSSGHFLWFDIDQERVREMPMPAIPDAFNRRVEYFGESKGHLHLVEIYHLSVAQFNVYEMETDYSGWCLKFHVDLDGVISAFPEMIGTYFETEEVSHYAYQIMCIVRGENDEDSYLVMHIPAKIIRYDFKDKTFKKLCDLAPGIGAYYKHEDAEKLNLFNSYEYIRSLTSV